MVLRDWIGPPNEHTGYMTRMTSWLNELVDQVRTNTTDIGTIETDLDYTVLTSYAPALTSLTGTATGHYSVSNGWCTYTCDIVMTGAGAAAAAYVALPVTAHASHRGRYLGLTAALRDAAPAGTYDPQIKIEAAGTTISFWSADMTGPNALWFGNAPVAIVATDTLSFTITYPV